MSPYRITPSERFKRDLRRARRRGCTLSDVREVIDTLAAGEPLPVRYKDHALAGKNAGCRECSLTPRCRLIYGYRDGRLMLYMIRTPWFEKGFSVFLLTEVSYRLFRKPACSALLLSIAALLVGAMSFYLGNISATRAALDSLSESVRVTVRVVNRTGTRQNNLDINPALCEALKKAPVRDLLCTASFSGAYGKVARAFAQEGLFTGGDVSVKGLNDMAAAGMSEGSVEFLSGWGPGMFTGSEAVCLVQANFAEENGLNLGDEVSLPLYILRRTDRETTYLPVGEPSMKIVGIYRPKGLEILAAAEFYAPVDWMKKVTEAEKKLFTYDSLRACLAEPMELNSFKASLGPMGFREVKPTSSNLFTGDAVVVEDEMFIKTAGELRENLVIFQRFMPTFFGVVIGMVTLVTFLVLRGSRKEMAIASSLGRQKMLNAASHFLGAFCAELAGCLTVLPVMNWILEIGMGTVWTAAGVYMVCACIGTALALVFLLQFDTLSMLTT